MTNRKLTMGFPTSYRWSAWFKKRFFRFIINVNVNRIKSATGFFCVKTSSGKVVAQPFPYLTAHRYWREK